MPPKQRKKQQSISDFVQIGGREGESFVSCPWCTTSVAASLLNLHFTKCASYLLQQPSPSFLDQNLRVEDTTLITDVKAADKENASERKGKTMPENIEEISGRVCSENVEQTEIEKCSQIFACSEENRKPKQNKDDEIKLLQSVAESEEAVERAVCCHHGEQLPFHGTISNVSSKYCNLERSLSRDASSREECQADEYMTLEIAFAELQSKYNALKSLQETTEKKYQESLSRELESQRQLASLQGIHEETLSILQSLEKKVEGLSVPAANDSRSNKDEGDGEKLFDPRQVSLASFDENLIAASAFATAGTDLQIREFCDKICSTKNACAIEAAQSEELSLSPQKVDFPSHRKVLTTMDTLEAPQNVAHLELPESRRATAVEKLSFSCMGPITPDQRPQFCCIGTDIPKGDYATAQSSERKKAPGCFQREKGLSENLRAACTGENLVQNFVGKSSIGWSADKVSFPTNEHSEDLKMKSLTHADASSFGTLGKTKATMGICNVRRRIIAESSDSETESQCLDKFSRKTKYQFVSRINKQGLKNHLDSEDENPIPSPKKLIIPISTDSDNDEVDKGDLKKLSDNEALKSVEVLSDSPVLKRLKKVGSFNSGELMNNPGVEEEDAAAEKAGKVQRHVFNIRRAMGCRVFQDSSEDEIENFGHDRRPSCEECEDEEIDSHPFGRNALNRGKHVVDKVQQMGTSDSSRDFKHYRLRRVAKRRLSYSRSPVEEDRRTSEILSHEQRVQKDQKFDNKKTKTFVNLLKESSGSESEDENEDENEESEGESLGGFIVEGSEDSEHWSKPNLLSENCSSNGSDDNSSASTGKCSPHPCESSHNEKFNWAHEAEFLAALGRDDELCLHALCALYRQQTSSERINKSSSIRNRRGFDKFHASKASRVAEFLTCGDSTGQLKKSVEDLNRHDCQGVLYCRDIAFHHSKQLFEIYQNGEDPYFSEGTSFS